MSGVVECPSAASLSRRLAAFALCVAATGSGLAAEHRRPSTTVDAGARAEQRALDTARALARVADAHAVVIVDPELAADPEAIRRLDAFTVREPDGKLRSKVYVNRQSPILREAARGSDFYVKVLAAVLVHEIAHLEGANEAGARLAERQFLGDLVRQGLLSETDGLRYLALLRHQSNGSQQGDR
jgi:hypothetical protein